MIAVKKSEFIEEYERNARSMPGAEAAAKAVEMAGMEWDPEEPELPKRLGLSTLNAAGFSAAMLRWERLGPKETMGWNEPEDRRVYREAAARWNFVTFLLEDYELHKEMATPRGGLLRAYNRRLQKEREKLQ